MDEGEDELNPRLNQHHISCRRETRGETGDTASTKGTGEKEEKVLEAAELNITTFKHLFVFVCWVSQNQEAV